MFNDNSLKKKLKQKFNIRMYPGVSFLSHDRKFATKLTKFYKNRLNKFYLKNKKKVIKIDYKDLISDNYVRKVQSELKKLNFNFSKEKIEKAFNHFDKHRNANK